MGKWNIKLKQVENSQIFPSKTIVYINAVKKQVEI